MLNICVIGAGPSGCVAAKKLCDEGYSVTIYEREKIPRHKHCAGYVSQRSTNILKSINIDCSTLLSRLNGFNLICEEKLYKIEIEGLAGNVYREEFDTYLLKQAKLNGTQIRDSTIISSISKNYLDSKYIVESRDLKE
jgi:flavin-dependent dehydrogenase